MIPVNILYSDTGTHLAVTLGTTVNASVVVCTCLNIPPHPAVNASYVDGGKLIFNPILGPITGQD